MPDSEVSWPESKRLHALRKAETAYAARPGSGDAWAQSVKDLTAQELAESIKKLVGGQQP